MNSIDVCFVLFENAFYGFHGEFRWKLLGKPKVIGKATEVARKVLHHLFFVVLFLSV